MAKDPRVEALARAFERVDMRLYGWTDEQFETWWTKDHYSKNNRADQRRRARLAIKFLDNYSEE